MGFGSWWAPSYTTTMYNPFFEHPPLVFWVQSFLFRIFGDSVFVEKFYSVFLVSLILLLVQRLIREVGTEDEIKWPHFLFTVVLLLATEPYRWGASYNLLDFTMCAFALLACLLQLRFLLHGEAVGLVLAPVCILLAISTKGPVGLYPLGLSAVAALTLRQRVPLRRAVICGGIVTTLFLTGVALVWFSLPEVQNIVHSYLSQHLLPALSGSRRSSGASGFATVLRWIFTAQGIAIGLAFLLWMISRRRTVSVSTPWIFWLVMGFSASLPIGFSHIFSQFYLIPSLPFFALALSSLVFQHTDQLAGRVPGRVCQTTLVVGAVILVGFSFWDITYHPIQRDRSEVEFSRSASLQPYQGQTLKTCAALSNYFPLMAYLMRYARISLKTAEDPKQWEITGTSCDPSIQASFQLVQ